MNQAKIVLFLMLRILPVKIQPKKTVSDMALKDRAYEIGKKKN